MTKKKKAVQESINPELLPLFFEYGIDIQKRLLYLGSIPNHMDSDPGVDFRMAERAIKGLIYLDNMPTPKNKLLPLTIILNTPGGDVDHGMAIYDAINSCHNPVSIFVYGRAHSMGSIILQAAKRRVLAPNASMMIHYGECGVAGHPETVDRWNEHFKRNQFFMEQLFLLKMKEKNKKITLKTVQGMLKFDTPMCAEDAIALGLADAIMGK